MGIDALAKQLFIEETISREHFTRLIVDINEKRTDNGNNNPLLDNNIYQTDGLYYVQFYPKKGTYSVFKFIVGGDIFRLTKDRVRVMDWDDFCKLGEKDARVKWVLENTNISEFHFKVAEENILVRVPVSLDIKKYSEKIGTIKYRNPDTEEFALKQKGYRELRGGTK